jgi:uncharacterized membrane protein YhaH (DUF805 family)
MASDETNQQHGRTRLTPSRAGRRARVASGKSGNGPTAYRGAMQPANLNDLLTFFFRPHGRIGRVEYALAIGMIVAIEIAGLAQVFGHGGVDPGLAFPMPLIVLPLLVAEWVVIAKRCHDIGLPGVFVVLLFVPLIGLLWLLLLAVMPGTPGSNLYGAPPDRKHD